MWSIDFAVLWNSDRYATEASRIVESELLRNIKILTFLKAEFFLTQGIFYHYLSCSSYSQQTFNLYPEGSLMKEYLKLYKLCS